MLTIYTLDGAINDFFKEHPQVTRKQCDDLAASLFGEPVHPVPIQGSLSYTVTAGVDLSFIVHFRSPKSELNIQACNSAIGIHGSLVPTASYHGTIGELQSQLFVYTMNKIPGSVYIKAQSQYQIAVGPTLESSPQHTNTVADLARYYARSWNKRQTLPADIIQAIHNDYQQKFQLLSENLPPPFTKNLRYVINGLPMLFTEEYPLALNHGEIGALKMLTEPSTGHITGIFGWSEARVLPFGMDLWGLENVLGYMNSAGWHYHGNHLALRDLFWETFRKEAIDLGSNIDVIYIARMAGIFLRYGLRKLSGADEAVVVGTEHTSFGYIEAFCADDE